jgi:RNA polymerase sigma factor (sigma-70 family)
MSAEFDDWFVREVLVHERALTQYLQHCWARRDEVNDLRQEVYARIYEAAARNRPTAPRAFLFATARHLMTDRLRRGRVVSIEPVGDFEPSNVYLVDEVSPERWFGTRQVLRRLVQALERLPDRCREVVWLRRVEELSQKEVAARMGVSEKTVEKQLAKGMRLIAGYLYGAEGDSAGDGAAGAPARPRREQDRGLQQPD